MKNLVVLLLLPLAIKSHAQQGFFIQPQIGAGITGATYKNEPISNFVDTYPGTVSTTTAYSGQIAAGYEYRHFQLSAGIAFEHSGFVENYKAGDLILENCKATFKFEHIAIPLSVGYLIRLGDHFYLLPSADVSYSKNNSVTETIEETVGTTSATRTTTLTGSQFSDQYNQSSIWAGLGLKAGFKISDHWSITAGPHAQYMLTSITQTVSISEKNYVYAFEAGVVWHPRPKQDRNTWPVPRMR